jgi:ABC-type multidrug transport system fused ATPase/permease subunit
VLKNVSVKISKGDYIALVGENGAGKSTFAKLLAGIISPSIGDIKVNGRSLSEFNIDSYYDTISTVSQDSVRYYTFTALENVKLGKLGQDINESMLREALDFTGYNGPFNEVLGKDIGGTELSDG